jgi:hypothetical protein
MSRILKIDQFVSSFPSIYGLECGFCYEVIDEFEIEILSEYKSNGTIQGLPYLEPVWSTIKSQKEDIISTTKRSCFIMIEGYKGVVECRPKGISKEGEPSFDKFPLNCLKKVGMDVIKISPLSKEDKKEICLTRNI